LVVLALTIFHCMLQLITILNRCHRFPGFVYQHAGFSSNHKSIDILARTADEHEYVGQTQPIYECSAGSVSDSAPALLAPGGFRNGRASH
jgi:hypothetical protein